LFTLARITSNEPKKMKVYQLMTLLEKAPAGAEVLVGMTGTLNAEVEGAEIDGEQVILTGGDAEVIDSNGDPIGWLSTLTEAAETEE
jgi:hypothetical protein